jgi:hypothetical protein
MQISGASLTLTLPLRFCLLRVFLGATATATSFPLPKHTGGGDTAPVFSGWCVYLQFTLEVGLPPCPVEFSSHCCFYKLSHSWLLGMCCRSCFLQPACEGFPLPPFSTQGTPPSLLCVFFVVTSYYSDSLFSLGGGQSVQGGYADMTQSCLWEYRIPLSSPCGPRLPKASGHCRLAVTWKPSWFLHLT